VNKLGSASWLLAGMGLLLILWTDRAERPSTDVAKAATDPAVQNTVIAELRDTLVIRTEVGDVAELRAEVARLTQENARLVKAVDAQGGLTLAALARVRPGCAEADVIHALNRSDLLPDAKALAVAGGVATTEEVWQALAAEAAYQEVVRTILSTLPPKSSPRAERVAWHDTVVVPRVQLALRDLCNKLHDLRIPSALIEDFRKRQTEGI